MVNWHMQIKYSLELNDHSFTEILYFSKLLTLIALILNSCLTLNAPIATKNVCFSRLLKCLRSLYGKCVDPDQTAPIGAVCSGSRLFASILNLSIMLGNYLQQTTFSDSFFSWRFKGILTMIISQGEEEL